ncbi:MAG: acyl-ACP--UDP-N-acetylglucosamine O-acyltransferase [Phyllobacteriaceae bacterium]|nr:acyl-ACP--UDP-N-acetylglucosamine O-acyltransferase [Phyllobacteriaceae bacterium]
MATFIHPLAIVETGAALGEGVHIGPYCHVGPQARIGDGVELKSHVAIIGDTELGARSVVWPNAVLGGDPQNKTHKGGPSRLVIGANCVIREGCTFNRGTDNARGLTTVGDNGYFMIGAHVAHDCIVGNNVTFANAATLGGHVEVDDFVTIGGFAAVHQFTKVGHHAFVAGMSALTGDLIPWGVAQGNRARLRGLNLVGMKRSGLPLASIRELKAVYRTLFDRAIPFAEALIRAKSQFAGSANAGELFAFFDKGVKRHFCMPAAGAAGDANDDDDD